MLLLRGELLLVIPGLELAVNTAVAEDCMDVSVL
jgi:hypothetical protein